MTKEQLLKLEKKYSSPPLIAVLKTDDSNDVYFLKRGKEDYRKVMDLQTDLMLLIRELQKTIV